MSTEPLDPGLLGHGLRRALSPRPPEQTNDQLAISLDKQLELYDAIKRTMQL